MSIKLCLDDLAADKNSKTNFETKSFDRIDLFMLKGLEVLKLRCALDINIYKPYGLTDTKSVDCRLNYFPRCLKGRTQAVYGKVFAKCKDKMLSGYNLEKEASEYSDNEFFKFISKDEVLTDEDIIKGKSKKDIKLMQASLISGDTNCEEFECMIWFELRKKMWKKHRNVF